MTTARQFLATTPVLPHSLPRVAQILTWDNDFWSTTNTSDHSVISISSDDSSFVYDSVPAHLRRHIESDSDTDIYGIGAGHHASWFDDTMDEDELNVALNVSEFSLPDESDEEADPPQVFPRRRVALQPADDENTGTNIRSLPSVSSQSIFDLYQLFGDRPVPARPRNHIGLPRVVIPTPPMPIIHSGKPFECPLCCEESSGQAITSFPCPAQHRFHYTCLYGLYLRGSFVCPLCRAQANIE
ncbi:MAG TPA: RING finger protein [Methylomirabilota bacterium]|nr:RING finger protein [Methylomirabilota bacterium]